MNPRTTQWLAGIALGLLVFILAIERRLPDTGQRRAVADRLFPGLDPAEVSAVEIQRTNEFLRAVRSAAGWDLRSPVDYPARGGRIEDFLSAVRDLRFDIHLTSREVLAQSNGLSGYGFSPPLVTVRLDAGGQQHAWRVGAPTPVGGQLFLQVEGREGVYVITNAFRERLPTAAEAWRDPVLLPPAVLGGDRFEVRPITNGFEVVRPATNRLWQMTRPLATFADNARLEFLFHQLQLANVTRFVSDDPRADLEVYGLQPPERELVFGTGANDTFTLQIGRSPTNAPELVYLRRLGQSNVVLASRAPIEPFLGGFREFCDRRLAIFLPAAVDRIEGVAEDAFALEKQTNGAWRIVAPFAAAADPLLVLEFLANLADLQFLRFEKDVVTDFAPFGLAPPVRQYTLLTALTNAAGVRTNQVMAQVSLGAAKGTELFARRNAENFVVTTIDPGRLPRAGFELRDRRLWHFTTNQVNAVTILQAGQTRRIVRGPAGQWTHAPGSEGVLNHFTFDEAIYRLGQLRAETWVALGTNAFVRYGLPALAHEIGVEWTAQGRSRTNRLQLGRLSAARRPYAAVTLDELGGPVIFECPRSIAEYLASDLSIPTPPGANPP